MKVHYTPDALDLERLEDLERHPGYALILSRITECLDRETQQALIAEDWTRTQQARAKREALLWVLQLPKQVGDEIRKRQRASDPHSHDSLPVLQPSTTPRRIRRK